MQDIIEMSVDHIQMQAHLDEDSIQISSGFQKFTPKGKVNFTLEIPTLRLDRTKNFRGKLWNDVK